MGFSKGTSGNPKGRPRGSSNHAKLRAAIAKDIPGIIEALAKSAKEGDVSAAKLLLDRVLPALRPVEQPVALRLGDTLTDTGMGVFEALSAGKIGPDQAAKLLTGLGTMARVIEVDELTKRIEVLEGQLE